MDIFQTALILSAFLCSLVAGFLLALATLAYVLGVQASTIAIHLPLNNKLQTIDVDTMNETDIRAARIDFEPRWNTSNSIRTIIAICVSILLIILVFRQ